MNDIKGWIPSSDEWREIVTHLQMMVVEYGVQVLGAIVLLVIGIWIAKGLRRIFIKLLERYRMDPTFINFLAGMFYVILQLIVIIATLETLNIKTASLITVIGTAGLAVGLALQGSLSNFAAGVMLIIFRPFKVGDFIRAAGIDGTVDVIGIFTTSMNTLDNKRVIVPNTKLTADAITNYTCNSIRRVDLTASISYSDDIDQVKKVIYSVLAEIDEIIDSPSPDVFVSEMAESSVDFVVRPWCLPEHYWKVFFAVTEGLKKKFDENEITIPFPQRDVHLFDRTV